PGDRAGAAARVGRDAGRGGGGLGGAVPDAPAGPGPEHAVAVRPVGPDSGRVRDDRLGPLAYGPELVPADRFEPVPLGGVAPGQHLGAGWVRLPEWELRVEEDRRALPAPGPARGDPAFRPALARGIVAGRSDNSAGAGPAPAAVRLGLRWAARGDVAGAGRA